MRVIMVFVDGLGLGDRSDANPLVFSGTPFLTRLLEGGQLIADRAGFAGRWATLVAVDSVLGVEGLPQSATGQAALFTGFNAPRLVGGHLSGFPNERLRRLLRRRGIFGQLQKSGYACTFLNAYRPPFFEFLRSGLTGRLFSCSTLITYYAGLPFRSLEDLAGGEALYMDITNFLLQKIGFAVTEISPGEAGRRLAQLSAPYDFALFEHFLTDLAGHAAERDEAERIVRTLDAFLESAVEYLDLENTLLILTSDHGNFEDLSHRRHTARPVPGLLVGPPALRRALAPALRGLTDFLPAVRAALAVGR